MNENAPCKDCADRHPGCHGSCEKYKAWRDRYHAQQKHLEENRYRWERPWSTNRERVLRAYQKFDTRSRKKGGSNE